MFPLYSDPFLILKMSAGSACLPGWSIQSLRSWAGNFICLCFYLQAGRDRSHPLILGTTVALLGPIQLDHLIGTTARAII